MPIPSGPAPTPLSDTLARSGRWEDFLPVLDLSAGTPDPMSITTWHLALSNLVAAEIPHEFFALWAFPARGGVLLIGPEAMAKSELVPPEPRPHLTQDQLFELEEVLRRAKYASAIALPIREPGRDVGVLLVGAFEPGRIGPTQAISLQRVAKRLSSSLGGLGRVVTAVGSQATVSPSMSLEELPTALAQAVIEAPNGPELVRRTSGVLLPLIPHDRFEILSVPSDHGPVVALSGTTTRRRWGGGGASTPHWTDLAVELRRLQGSDAAVVIAEVPLDAPQLRWPPPANESERRLGSLLAAPLWLGGSMIGWVVFGHAGQGVYRPEDEAAALLVARLVAARVAVFRLEAENEALSTKPDDSDPGHSPAVRAALALGAMAHLGDALHHFQRELQAAIPHREARYALILGEDEFVELRVHALRPLADLPPERIETNPLRAVLVGERASLLITAAHHQQLAVPLRVAGRVVGALVIEAERFADAESEIASRAEEFAAVVAPHLELVRRGAVIPRKVKTL